MTENTKRQPITLEQSTQNKIGNPQSTSRGHERAHREGLKDMSMDIVNTRMYVYFLVKKSLYKKRNKFVQIYITHEMNQTYHK